MTKNRILNILKNKFVAGVFAFALVILGMGLFTEANEVQATETTTSTVAFKSELLEVSKYFDEDGNRIAPKPSGEGYEDWIFAGWYKEADCKTAMNSKKGERWAKFVPSEVLSVKCQVTADSVEDPTSSLRLVSTVDSLRYSKVGFEVTYGFGAESLDIDTTNVYQRIESAFEGQEYGFSPNIFDLQSEYFITATLTNIGSDYYDDGFFIKPYWVTLDGTKVYGVSRYARVEDSYLNIVNVPVRLYSDESVAGGNAVVDYSGLTSRDGSAVAFALYSVEGDETASYDVGDIFSSITVTDDATNKQVTCTLPEGAEAKADGMLVNLRFKMQVEKAVLPKTNAFGVTANLTKADSQVANVVVSDAVYNYYHTEYTNNPDTSWYDSSKTEFVITTPDELYGLAELVNATTGADSMIGKTIYLASDISVNEVAEDGTIAQTYPWIPIGWTNKNGQHSNGFEGIFDGQNHTISGLYTTTTASTVSGEGGNNWFSGLFGVTYQATIENVKLIDSYFEGTCNVGTIVGCGFETTIRNTYSNASAHCTAYQGGGIVGALRGGTIQECWFAGSASAANAKYGFVGGMVGVSTASDVTIQNCLNSGTITGYKDLGGLVGDVQNTTRVIDSLNVGTITGIATKDIGSGVGRVEASGTLVTEEVYTLKTGEYNPLGTMSGTVQSASGTSLTTTTALTSFDDKTAYYGYDAITGLSGLDYDATWVVRQSNTPALANWTESDALYAPDTEWAGSGTEEEPWIIKTASELYGLANSVNTDTEVNGYAGKYFKLGANITVNSGTASRWEDEVPKYNWFSIGAKNVPFKGTFDGANYTIKGLYAVSSTPTGLFVDPDGVTVKNLKLTNSYLEGGEGTAAIAGWNAGGTFDTIYTDAIVVTKNHGAGIAALINEANTKITNCWFDGELIGKKYVGGLTSYISVTGVEISNCLVTAPITSTHVADSNGTRSYAAGMIGDANVTLTMENCLVGGDTTVTGTDGMTYLGSIAGRVGTSSTISDVYAETAVCSTTANNGNLASITKVDDLTGANGYLETYLTFDRHEEHLPEKEQHDGAWVARTGDVPGLKSFVDADDRLELVKEKTYRADDRWYNTTDTEFTIKTAEELVGFASLVEAKTSFANKTVKLGTDITLNAGKASEWYTGTNITNLYEWEPMGSAGSFGFDGTFAGQNHTISGVYSAVTTNGNGFFCQIDAGATVKEFWLKNSLFSGKQGVAALCGWYNSGTIDTVYSDAYVKATAAHAGGLVMGSYANSTIRNCWFAGEVNAKQYVGGISGFVPNSDVTIQSCLFTGTIVGTSQVGGILGRVTAPVTINDTLSTGNVKIGSTANPMIVGWAGKASDEVPTVPVTCNNVYALGSTSKLYTVGTGGSVTGVTGVDDLTGANGFLNTWLTFDRPELAEPTTGYWVAVADSTPVLKSFLGDAERVSLDGQNLYRTDTRWYDEEKTEFTITTVEQLIGFANLVNGGTSFAEKTVKLGANINVNAGNAEDWANGTNTSSLYPWTPIGTTTHPFDGKFNTDNDIYEISGLYATSSKSSNSTWYVGLFGYVKDAEVKNVKVLNSYIQAAFYAGAIVGTSETSTVDTVYANAIVKATSGNSAGVVGSINGGTLSKAWFDGSITNPGQYTGGIVGVSQGDAIISNCLATGSVTSTTSKSNAYAGGIFGGATGTTTVSDCLSALKAFSAKTTNASGSVAGGIGIAGVTASATNSYAVEGIYTKTYGTGNGTITASITAVDDLTNYKGFMNTNLDFDNTWVAMEESVPRLQSFATADGRFDTTSWFTKAAEGTGTTEANPYIIDSLADLYGFTKRVKDGNTFENQYIKLTESITVNTGNPTEGGWATTAPYYVWSPIGGYTNQFKGNFDGGMNTISGLYATASYGTSRTTWYTGLFGLASGATIKNIRVEDSYFSGAHYAAGIVGWLENGTVDTAYSNAIVETTTGNAAVIVGAIDGGTIQNAWSDGNATAPSYAGGITSFATNSESAVQHCLNTGTINATSSQAGGIVGRAASTLVTIDDCLSVGTVTAPSNRGTILGYMPSPPTDSETKEYTTTYVTTITSSYGYSDSSVPNSASTAIGVVKDGSTATGGEKITSLAAIYDLGAFGEQKYTAKWTETKDDGSSVVHDATNDWVARLDYNNWTARIDDVPVPSVFADKVQNAYTIDTSWYDDAEETATQYSIENVADFYGLALLSQTNDFNNKTITLADNMIVNTADVTEENAKVYKWLPIGDMHCAFAGEFNGNDKTISGLYREWKTGESLARLGLFDTIASTSNLHDFNIRNAYFGYTVSTADNTRVGSVAGGGSGTITNVSSDATLVSKGLGTGGMVGVITGDMTISNCWYSGKATADSSDRGTYLGGIAGYATAGTVCIEKSHVNGSITSTGYRAGGILGDIQGTANVVLNNCLFSGDIKGSDKLTGDVFRVGQLVGTLQATKAATPTLNIQASYGVNDFASYDVGAIATFTDEATSTTYTPTVTGRGYVSVKNDRLIGYIASDLYEGDSVPLDFAGGTWVLTKEFAPKLSVFATDEEIYDASQLEDLFKLSTFGKSLQDAEDTGAGHYTVKITGKTIDDYNNYCEVLEAGIFDAYNNDQSTTLNGEGVYNMVYTSAACSDAANDDWVVNVTYVDGTITITITTTEKVLSQHLKAESIQPYTTAGSDTDDGYTASTPQEIKFHMIEQQYDDGASSYIIQLANGHFIVIDGGINSDAPYLMEYLENLVPEDGKKPIVEAWIFSHAHYDHVGTLSTFVTKVDEAGNKVYKDKIYVEGIYYNEANDKLFSDNVYKESSRQDGHHHWAHYINRIGSVFKTTKGAEPQIYRMYTGQQFTFDTVVMEVMLGLEQFDETDYKESSTSNSPNVFNETSTWTMFYLNGKKLLTAGDSNILGKTFVKDAYSESYLTVDVFTALHHGTNINRESWYGNEEFESKIKVTGAVLYSYPLDWLGEDISGKTTMQDRIRRFMNKQIEKGMAGFVTTYEGDATQTDENGYFYHGQGTLVLTFGDSITAKVLAHNDWVNDYAPAETTTEE